MDRALRRSATVLSAVLLFFFLAREGVAASPLVDRAKLRAAIEDLRKTFGDRYPQGAAYLDRLARIESEYRGRLPAARRELERLRQEALLANPLLKELPGLLLVKRRPKDLKVDKVFSSLDEQIGYSAGFGREIGMPSNHECNASLEPDGYENEICLLSPVSPKGELRPVYRPSGGGYVGDLELHFDANRILFTQSDLVNWKLWEMRVDGRDLRQVSQLPNDVDAMDGCYLPNGRIIFGATASYQSVPCWHGRQPVCNLYVMDADGSNVRQLCFDQDHNFHPAVLPSGQVLYQLMTMNPDGTRQRAVYGSNSWFPNSLFFARSLPDADNRLLCILSGYHGAHRMGQLVVVDTSVGWQEESGIVQRISGRGFPVTPKVRDALVNNDWPKFLHPFPLSDKYFLVSACDTRNSTWKIYLADVFDNLVAVHESSGYALLEPTPLMPQPMPPVIPDQVDLSADDATVFVSDVYAGPGLAGVPRGTVKQLRVVAYHFGYRGLAGSDKIGYGGPWDAMRILGTTPVEEDGSASFRVPANTPVSLQTLDDEGKAVQLMRSWFTAMPGEQVSCVGCHERPADGGDVGLRVAAQRPPSRLNAWYGPPRGFDFEREVQPVLDRYCVSCHDGSQTEVADLRSEADGGTASAMAIGYVPRLPDEMRRATGGRLKYSPAYDVLVHYIRRVGIEDDVSLLAPGEYHADTSELVQMLQKGHHGVELDREAWDRIITWIDLNGPCHGTWGDVYPVPAGAHQRRMELRSLYGGPSYDPERIFEGTCTFATSTSPEPMPRSEPLRLEGWPQSGKQASAAQLALGDTHRVLKLADDVVLQLVRIPAGRFVMGDVDGESDEHPERIVDIQEAFWMGTCEVTNAQFRCFDPSHDSGYYVKRRDRADGKGLSLNNDLQPVVRVSWQQAMAFCEWLSQQTGTRITLPTEEQWEYACRAGRSTPLNYGSTDDDFAAWGNMADRRFNTGLMNARGGFMPEGGVTQVTGGVPHLLLEGAKLADTRFDDGFRVTAEVGSYQANAWGLHDMHGNAAEGTLGEHPESGEKYVRGGSFFERPTRCRSSFRLRYPSWQRVFNVGFRIVCEETSPVSNKPRQ